MSLDSQNPFNPSDPHARFVSTSCLDLLLIEIVPMAERITQDLLVNSTTSSSSTTADGTSNAIAKIEDDEIREATFYRLEMLGYRVGQGLAERYIPIYLGDKPTGWANDGIGDRFSRDRPRFTDNLDVIKFICKDLWTILFRKQVDNLKTNHRVYPRFSLTTGLSDANAIIDGWTGRLCPIG